MGYFIVSVAPYVVTPIVPIGINPKSYPYKMTEEAFVALEELQIAYFDHEAGSEICDILQKPTFLISDKVKRLWQLYDSNIIFKGLQLFANSQEDRTAALYWLPQVPVVTCVHPATTFYDNGHIQSLVLKKEAIEGYDIFRVHGLLEDKVIISLSVAESLLRRQLYGIGLEKVEVR